jgi:predicted DNA-binding transcriptional regulator AlpA
MPRPFLNVAELAIYLGVARHSLYEWRVKGTGPPWFRLGKKIKYRPEDVEDWIAEQQEKELERQGSS